MIVFSVGTMTRHIWMFGALILCGKYQ